ncbi:MAG: hypothetical protein FWG33_02610 [Oscillospiraceae bacterium]|nr:hypothetical protein [Oscillospiraceae bacterium]
MLTTIEQLEKEIDTFYDNVAASNELMRIIKEIADAVINQNKVLSEQSSLLELAVSNINKSGNAGNAGNAGGVSSDIDSSLSDIKKIIHEIPDKITYDSSGLLKKTLAGLLEVKVQYTDAFAQTQSDFRGEIENYKLTISTLRSDMKSAVEVIEKLNKNSDLANSENQEKLDFSEIEEMLKKSQKEFQERFQAALETTRQSTINDIQKSLSEIPEKISEIPGQISNKISDDNMELTKKTLAKMLEIQTQCSKEMESYKFHVSEVQDDFKSAANVLNEKYDDFLRYIETLDIREIHDICEEVRNRQKYAETQNSLKIGDISTNVEHQVDEMNKRMNKKMIPVYFGLGLTTVLLIVSLIVR